MFIDLCIYMYIYIPLPHYRAPLFTSPTQYCNIFTVHTQSRNSWIPGVLRTW